MDLLELDRGRARLQQVLGKHGLEVGRGGRQQQAVGRNLPAVYQTESGQVRSGLIRSKTSKSRWADINYPNHLMDRSAEAKTGVCRAEEEGAAEEGAAEEGAVEEGAVEEGAAEEGAAEEGGGGRGGGGRGSGGRAVEEGAWRKGRRRKGNTRTCRGPSYVK